MEFCSECGSELELNAKFCKVCGKKVEKVKSGSTYFTDGMTIRLYYKRNKYSLSYVFEENQYSSILEGQNYTYGDVYYGAEIVKPNLQQTGMYTLYSCEHSAYGKIPFNGYEDLITMPDSDLIIHVYYSPCWYWLNYHYVNQFGGNGTHRDSKAIKYGTERSLELYASLGGFNRPGYSFIGWTTEENGTTVEYNDGETVINLADKECTVDLYPVWKPITVNISVKFYEPGVNGTMNPVSDTSLITNLSDFENLKLTYGTNLVLPEPIINRPGYFFEYWSSGDTTAAGEAGMKGWNNTNAQVTYDNVNFKELADGDTIYISGMISLKNYNINWNTCRDDVSVTFAYSGQKTINALIGKQGIQALNVVIDKRSVTTAANIYEFDGWYTKPEGKGYKQEYNSEGFIALYNVNDSSLYDISKFPEDIDLSSDGSTITFYANWIPTPCKYTVTVHPIGNMIDQSYGVLGFNYSTIEYTTQGYDKMYKTANIPDETLAAPKTMGELKGWAVYDEENRPVLDDRGKQVYWDGNNGLQNTLIDGKYKNINLYPDVDCNLWLFGQRVNTIEAMTKNYAPNTDGKATFDFKSTVLLLENCEITSSGDGLTNGNSNTYSLITSDIEGSLAIRVKGKNTMNINVNDNSREIAAIAAHKGKIDLRNLDGNQTNELIIKVKQEAESDKLVCGISVSSGYYQDMNLVDINIQGNALRNAGIKAEAKCYVYGELFIVIPYKEDNAIGAAIQVPVDHEINDNSAFTELHFGSDTKLALFGYRATQAILKGTFSNNVLTDSGEKDLDYRKAQFAHYYVMNFSENDVKWTEIQGYITDIKKLPSYRNLGIV